MKIAIIVVMCMIGYTMGSMCYMSSDCTDTTTCGNGYESHCVDNNCFCLSPATGASCQHSSDCENADHGHEHCQFDGDKEWKCSHDFCRCVKD